MNTKKEEKNLKAPIKNLF